MITRKTRISKVHWKLLTVLGAVTVGVSGTAGADDKIKPDDRNVQYRIGPDGKPVAVVVAPVPDSPAFARFNKWVTDYTAANDEQKARMEEEGIRLAVERRQAMAELIQRNPKRALELAIYPEQRAQLPSRVVGLLEDFLQGRGQNSVLVATIREEVPVPNQPGKKQTILREDETRSFLFRGRVYQPHFYGKRDGMMSKSNLPFYGVALDGHIAIHENPLRVLSAGETVSSQVQPGEKGTLCPVCGKDAKDAKEGKTAILGTTLLHFDTQEHFQQYLAKLWEIEQQMGPNAHG